MKDLTKRELLALKDKILSITDKKDIYDFMPHKSAYDYLLARRRNHLNDVAINYLGRTITYKELFDKIDSAAKAFYELGVKEGDFVTVSMLTTPESIITFYALNKIGAVINMTNILTGLDKLESQLEATQSKLLVMNDIFYTKDVQKVVHGSKVGTVVTCSLLDSLPFGFIDKARYGLIEKVKSNKAIIENDDLCINWANLLKIGDKSNAHISSVYKPNEGACIAYTSGSTGNPKGVLATNESINAIPFQMELTEQKIAPNDSIFNTLPSWIFYSLVNNTHEPLCLGVTVDLDPLFNSKNIAKRIKQYRFNHWNTIPAYAEKMFENKKVAKLDLSCIKTIATGGDFLDESLERKGTKILKDGGSKTHLAQGYGASEIMGSFCYTYYDDYTLGSVGKPLVGNSFKIVDLDTLEELGPNQIGELYLFSPSIMKEYYRDKQETESVLIKDNNGIIWYRTGDLGHYNDKGELFIDGRLRRIIMAADENGQPTKIFPEKIKKVILNNEFVEKCEIITIPDFKYIKRPVAYIVLKDGIDFDEAIKQDLEDRCRNNLPGYSIPVAYECINSIPLTENFKPDLKALEKDFSEKKQSDQKAKRLLIQR